MAIEPQAIPAEDVMFMSRAIQLAREGWYTTHPNPRVGCVIVRDGRIVGEGFHHRTGEPHAEIHALRQAGTSARGATVYTTLEPCNHQGRTPPCSKALIEAGVGRVMVAMQDPDLRVSGTGLIQLEAGGVKTACGLLESEARALNPGFIRRMEQHRPWIRIKSAMSLDGRTATASGESRWITNLAARTDVQHWRAQADALLTGVNSVLADDPAFNVRLSALELGIEGVVRQPVRVILDSHLRTPPEAQILTTGRVLLVCLPDADPCRRALLEARGADIRVLPEWKGKLDLAALFSELAVLEINEVQVEAGATLAGAIIAAGLADELLLYVSPTLLGDQAKGLFVLPGLEHLRDRIAVDIHSFRRIGSDWRIQASLVGD